jgi:hypothetical protein
VTLELNRLTGQVDAMGEKMAQRRNDTQKRGAEAVELLSANPNVTEELNRKIEKAREIDEWRRGAKPLGSRLNEHRRADLEVPEVVLIAADGSQIFPDRHSITNYYLVNTGTIVLRKGSGQAPGIDSEPEIHFEDDDVYDDEGQLVSNEDISLIRGRREIEALARLAEKERAALGGDVSTPIVALIDGPLLPWLRPDPQRSDRINEEIDFVIAQLDRLRKARAIPIGYVDRPGSAFVLRILELLKLPIEGITREALRKGDYIGLTDRVLFGGLDPNERSGLFTPNTNANDRYQARSGGDRVAFAYLNVAHPSRGEESIIARIETPGWVAARPEWHDIAQAAIYANCEPTGYPYVLARAHELAVVTQGDRAELDSLLTQVMLRNGLVPEISVKASNKLLTGRTGR